MPRARRRPLKWGCLREKARYSSRGRPWGITWPRAPSTNARATNFFDVIQTGKVKLDVVQSYGLEQAAHAHKDLQARKTTGSVILTI